MQWIMFWTDTKMMLYFTFFQLAETLQAENPNVEITVVELEREGICLRFAPLESVHGGFLTVIKA